MNCFQDMMWTINTVRMVTMCCKIFGIIRERKILDAVYLIWILSGELNNFFRWNFLALPRLSIDVILTSAYKFIKLYNTPSLNFLQLSQFSNRNDTT
jgi:hypothetical protein